MHGLEPHHGVQIDRIRELVIAALPSVVLMTALLTVSVSLSLTLIWPQATSLFRFGPLHLDSLALAAGWTVPARVAGRSQGFMDNAPERELSLRDLLDIWMLTHSGIDQTSAYGSDGVSDASIAYRKPY